MCDAPHRTRVLPVLCASEKPRSTTGLEPEEQGQQRTVEAIMLGHRRRYALGGLVAATMFPALAVAAPLANSRPAGEIATPRASPWLVQYRPGGQTTHSYGPGGQGMRSSGYGGQRPQTYGYEPPERRSACSDPWHREWFVDPWQKCPQPHGPGTDRVPIPAPSHSPTQSSTNHLTLVLTVLGIGALDLGVHHARRRWRHKPPPSVSVTLGMDAGHVRIVRHAPTGPEGGMSWPLAA
jgi:hypothetical protein